MHSDIDELLYFLNKEEKNKIKEKYKDTTLSKEEVLKEICRDYNLDYDNTIRKNNLDKDITNISGILATFIRDIIKIVRKNTYNKSIVSILETIVKIIVFVIVVMIFKIPFMCINYIIKYINNMLFYPFNYPANTIMHSVSSLIYIITCIIFGLKMFGNYRGIEKKEYDQSKVDSVDRDYKSLDKIIRIIIYLVVLIPLSILLLINFVAFILSIYIVITGVSLYGLPVMFLGIMLIIIYIMKIFKDNLSNKKESKIIKLSISSLIFIVGVLLTIYNVCCFKNPTSLKDSTIKSTTESITIKLDEVDSKIIVYDGKYDLITDNSMEGNSIKIEATYYDDYYDINYWQEKVNNRNYLVLKPVSDEYVDYKQFINSVHKDLKNGYIFNYSKLKNIVIKIYGNEDIISSLEKVND